MNERGQARKRKEKNTLFFFFDDGGVVFEKPNHVSPRASVWLRPMSPSSHSNLAASGTLAYPLSRSSWRCGGSRGEEPTRNEFVSAAVSPIVFFLNLLVSKLFLLLLKKNKNKHRDDPRAFYALLVERTEELLPYLYTPTVGEVTYKEKRKRRMKERMKRKDHELTQKKKPENSTKKNSRSAKTTTASRLSPWVST